MAHSNAQQSFWDNFAETYSKAELINFQGGFSSFLMAQCQQPGARVLEVGCASGIGSEIVAMSLISKQESPVYVVSDFSEQMMQLTARRMAESDYKLIEGNKLVMDTETDYISNGQQIDLDAIVAEQGTFRKLVYGCRASGSALPFPDAWFSCYVSNLVLQLIDSAENQIREAYRVLKPGSAACFTVWGRRENSLMFTAIDEAKKRMAEANGQQQAAQTDAPAEHSNFDIGRDMDERYLSIFREAGFSQVKRWYQAQNHVIRTGADFVQTGFNTNLRNMEPALQEAVKSTYDELSGANTPDLRVFEVMVVLAFKD